MFKEQIEAFKDVTDRVEDAQMSSRGGRNTIVSQTVKYSTRDKGKAVQKKRRGNNVTKAAYRPQVTNEGSMVYPGTKSTLMYSSVLG